MKPDQFMLKKSGDLSRRYFRYAREAWETRVIFTRLRDFHAKLSRHSFENIRIVIVAFCHRDTEGREQRRLDTNYTNFHE
jgi:hypothetical protein